MNYSNWTGRTHRNMSSAFGPYTDRRLVPLPTTRGLAARIYGVLLAVVIGIVLALGAIHYLSK